jgi:hypothetical protein
MNLVPAMRKLGLLVFLLAHAASSHARLGLPLVDLAGASGAASHLTATSTSIAIWSYTDVTINAGDTLTVHLPVGWMTPTVASVASCGCIFAKYMYPYLSGGVTLTAFTPAEVTMTTAALSGTASTWGLDLIIPLPVSPSAVVFAPGPFYLRIDDTANFKNPITPGLATFTVSFTNATGTTTTESRAISIGNGLTTMGQITGTVTTSFNGAITTVKGALVIADTDTTDTVINALPLWDLGPTAGTVTAKPTTVDRYTTVTGADGRYSLQVPYNSSTLYHVAALYYGSTGTAAVSANRRSAISSVTVNSTGPTSQNLTGFSNTTNP